MGLGLILSMIRGRVSYFYHCMTTIAIDDLLKKDKRYMQSLLPIVKQYWLGLVKMVLYFK
jgi:hypothetical protein